MMKAEIAREIIRSRTQTPMPAPRRGGTIGRGSAAAVATGVATSPAPTGFGSENVPDMRSYCIHNQSYRQRVPWRCSFNRTLILSRASGPPRQRVTITKCEDIFHETSLPPKQDRVPQPDPGFSFPGSYSHYVRRMGIAAGRRGRARL